MVGSNNIINSSLKAQQSVMETILNNIANMDVPGYSQREQPLASNAVGRQNLGVSVLPEKRISDSLRTEDVRIKTIGNQYLATLENFYEEIQFRLGEPGDNNSLGSRFTSIKAMVAQLNDSPEIPGKRNELLRVISESVEYINELGRFYQQQRAVAEDAITDSVKDINRIVNALDIVNNGLAISYGKNNPLGSYQDQQDQLLKELSKYLDIKILRRESLKLDVTLNNGTPLLSPLGVSTMEFEPAAFIGPEDGPADLGQIILNGTDVTNMIKSGKMGALIKARDTLFPGLQAQIDELAANLRDQVNRLHNQGTGSVTQTLTGTRSFAAPAVTTMEMTGEVRLAVVDNLTGNFVGAPLDLDLTGGPTTIDDVVNQINTHFTTETTGTAVLNADGQLVLTAANPTHGFAIVSMTIPEATETTTNLGFSHFFGLNDLLTTEDRFIEDGDPSKVGLAQKLHVRSDILDNSNLISRGQLYTGNPVLHPQALLSGDASALNIFIQGFDKALMFDGAGTMTPRQESLINYANSIWHDASVEAKNNHSDYGRQSTILEKSEIELKSRIAVNLQEQFTKLMDSHKVYSASLRCLQEINKTIDSLLAI